MKFSCKILALTITFLILFPSFMFADEFEEQMRRASLNELENPIPSNQKISSDKKVSLTVEEAVQYVIQNNVSVQNAKYEIIKADSPELKNRSKFVWKMIGGVTVFKNLQPLNNANLFAGAKLNQDKITAGFEKQFKTGSYFKLEGYSQRFDSSAFENPNTTPSRFAILGAPPLYTGGLNITLSQELWKYSFGKYEDNLEVILKNQTKMKRDEMVNLLTQLVVSVLIDYWSLSIYDSQVETYEKLLSNTKEIRNLTIRKRNLGLSESFEVNQWNSILSKNESLLENARIERLKKERDLIRILNVDPNSSISGVTDLYDKAPKKFNLEKDIEYAYKNRLDLIMIKRSREMTRLGLENAYEMDEPSLKASLRYGSIDQNYISPLDNWNNPRGVYSFMFPQIYAELKMDYPLWNAETKAEIKAASIDSKELAIREKQLRDSIKDELSNRSELILSSFKILEETKETQKQTESYYNGLVSRFRQGRFNAISVKSALDSLVQSDLAVTQAKINYNINLLRYELAKNAVFENYGVDIYRIIGEAMKEAEKQGLPSSGSLSE
ncbi:MAG: TolC family protein [Leptospiraceae bacterium]|nr:TolC family protein [Leptospiraceae bacterium]